MIIFRYLAKEVLITTAVITLILLTIFLSNQFVHFLNEIAAGKLAISLLFHLLLLETPFLLGYLLPIGFFFGILLAYGRLYADSEMTILRANGIGPFHLLGYTLKFSICIFLLVSILVLWLGPKAALALQENHRFENGQLLLQMILPQRFIPASDGKHVLYVESMTENHSQLNHVFTAEMKKTTNDKTPAEWVITLANTAYEKIDPVTGQFYMMGTKGYRYSGTPGKNDYEILKFGTYGLLIPDSQKNVPLDEKTVSLNTLLKTKNKNLTYEAEWQWRWSMPFSIFILVLLAVPLSRVRPRQGKFAKLFPATLLYILYANLLFVARSAIQNGQLNPHIGLWIVHIPALILGLILLANDYGWRNFRLIREKK